MSKVSHGGKGQGQQAVPPTVLTEKLSTYAFGTVAAGAVMVAAAAWMGGSLASIDERIQSGFDKIAGATGFTVANISVEGLGPGAKADILNAIGMEKGANMFRADPFLIKARLDKLDSVSQVSVMRQWPNEIWVIADERNPLALWQHDGEWHVVDQFGVAFEHIEPQAHSDLPRVVGVNGGEAAPALLDLLKYYPDFAENIETALRVGGRRWDLRMTSGLEISMPEDSGFAEALELVLKLDESTGILTGHAARIDARDPVHFAILPDADMARLQAETTDIPDRGA